MTEGAVHISIVVPVFRSAACVEKLAARIEEVLAPLGRPFELILVNDCSPDDSWRAILESARRHPFVRGLDLRKNVGQDNAIMAGLHEVRGRVVIIMDDDLQHDPADIPRLAAKINEGYDVCFARFPTKHHAWWKNLGSRLNSAAARLMVGKPKGLYLSPFKAMARGVADEVVKYDGPYSYVDGLLLDVTSRLCEIEATHHHRFAGEGNYNLVRSVRVWLKLVTGFSVVPLRVASVCGLALTALAALAILYFIREYLVIGSQVPGWLSLMLSLLFLGGVQLLALGLIGEYVGRTYLKLNRKVQFAVRATTESNDASAVRRAGRG